MSQQAPIYPILEKHLSVIVEGTPNTESNQVLNNVRELDQLLKKYQEVLEPRIVHFLSGRSYSKALDWIRNEKASTQGNCSSP